jgi:hypothetical protein
VLIILVLIVALSFSSGGSTSASGAQAVRDAAASFLRDFANGNASAACSLVDYQRSTLTPSSCAFTLGFASELLSKAPAARSCLANAAQIVQTRASVTISGNEARISLPLSSISCAKKTNKASQLFYVGGKWLISTGSLSSSNSGA